MTRRQILLWIASVVVFAATVRIVWPTTLSAVAHGVVIGSLTALLAFAVAIVHRASRVINLAAVELGMIPFGVFLDHIALRGGSFWYGLAVALVVAAITGAAVERLIMRWFARAPRLPVMVATIGLAQLLVAARASPPSFLRLPDTIGFLTAPRPTAVGPAFSPPIALDFKVGIVSFHGNHVLALGAVLLVTPLLVWFMRRSTIGLALRAGAENADRVRGLGISLDRAQMTVWAIAAALAALAIILRSGVYGPPGDFLAGPHLLLLALTAAVLGRMENFGVILAAAVGGGVLETCIHVNTGSPTLVDPIMFVVLAVALVVQGQMSGGADDNAGSTWQQAPAPRPIPHRLRRLPEVVVTRRVLIGIAVGLAIWIPVNLEIAQAFLVGTAVLSGLVGLSMVILAGWGGEISLGQLSFVAVGAGVAINLTEGHGWEPVMVTVAGAIVAAVVSGLVGLPALRVRGTNLAVITLSFGVAGASWFLVRDYNWLVPERYSFIDRHAVLGRWHIGSEQAMYVLALFGFIALLLIGNGLRRSAVARAIIAARDNPRVAQSFGLDPRIARVGVFALSGAFAGAAGALIAIQQRTMPDEFFLPAENFTVLAGTVIGGAGSLLGAGLGTTYVYGLRWFANVVPSQYRDAFVSAGTGSGLLFVLLFLPAGIGGAVFRLRDRLLGEVAARRGLPAPGLGQAMVDQMAWRTEARARRTARLVVPAWLRLPPASGRSPSAVNALEVRNLRAAYGPVQVLFGVDLDVAPGQVVAMLGINGAGKSTVLHAISGLLDTTAGEIRFGEVDLSSLAPHVITARGVVQIPGGRALFPSLTVADHLRLAGLIRRRDRAGLAADRAHALELFPDLVGRERQRAGSLSKGQQQMLALAMGLLARPKVLLIDELSLGLSPVMVNQLVDVIGRLRDEGIAMLIVEQSLDVALRVADVAYFLEKGEVRFSGAASELQQRPDLVRSVFLGGATARASIAKPERATETEVVLRAEGLSKRYGGIVAAADVSFSLAAGEILGLLGPNGAGKTTVFDLVCGYAQPDRGQVFLKSENVTWLRPEERAKRGLGRSFQDARLFSGLTVEETLRFAARHGRGMVVANEMIERFALQSMRELFLHELSTGSRRVVDIACQLAARSDVLLFDEPSSGIAQRETEALVPLLLSARDELGAGLLVVEHDMRLLSSIADRIIALQEGSVIAEGTPAAVLADPQVVSSFLGTTTPAKGGRRSRPRDP